MCSFSSVLGVFIIGTFSLQIASTVCAVFVLIMHHRGDQGVPVPKLLRALINDGLGTMVMCGTVAAIKKAHNVSTLYSIARYTSLHASRKCLESGILKDFSMHTSLTPNTVSKVALIGLVVLKRTCKIRLYR